MKKMIMAGTIPVVLLMMACSAQVPAAQPAPTVTVTAAPAPAPTVTVTVTAEPTRPTTDPATFDPKPKDFKIKIKILEKECFGDAGCSIDFRIDPEYVGKTPLPETGVIEVTYEITGPEDGANVNTFTIEGGRASFDEEESASTPSNSTKLKANVTSVTYHDDFS